MRLIKTYDNRIDKTKDIEPKRISVRAIIKKDSKLYLVHLMKTNEYKFPGGGVEANESYEEALIRETLEESGARITNILSCLGYIDQIWPDKYVKGETFFLRSIYYFCEVVENHSELNLSKNEEKFGFTPGWIDLDTAISTNLSCINKGSKYHWTQRELYMFNLLKKNI